MCIDALTVAGIVATAVVGTMVVYLQFFFKKN